MLLGSLLAYNIAAGEDAMGQVTIERLGGNMGFGGDDPSAPPSPLVSDAVVPLATLSEADRQRVEAIFASKANKSANPTAPHAPRYRLSRLLPSGETESVTVHGDEVPVSLTGAVRDRFR